MPDESRDKPVYGVSGEAENRLKRAHRGSSGLTGEPSDLAGAGFGGRLRSVVGQRGALCVGVDPHPELLQAWGLPLDAGGLERFALSTVEALAGVVAVLKPQSAFFESYGARGVAVLERTIAEASARGALVVLDVKRGDIGSTMAAYAAAYLTGGSPLAADAVTLSPYLGFESLRPALVAAASANRGVFVLARTSNPEGGAVQEAVYSGRTVAQSIVDQVATENARYTAAGRLGHVGVVIGATAPHGLDLTGFNGPVLAPGLGRQGATVPYFRMVFQRPPPLLLPSTSRDVLRRGPDPAELRRAAHALLIELTTGIAEQTSARAETLSQ
jgi:orotidine-5'-phosphate decarboxylase